MFSNQSPNKKSGIHIIQIYVGLAIILVSAWIVFASISKIRNRENQTTIKRSLELPQHLSTADYQLYHAETILDTINKGGSLFLSLKDNDIDEENILVFIKSFKKVFNLKRSYPGDTYAVTVDTIKNAILHLEYNSVKFKKNKIIAARQDDSFNVYSEKIPLNKVVTAFKGEITSALNILHDAIILQGGNPGIVGEFAEIFAWEIDFYTETRIGDKFEILVEEYLNNGAHIEFGKIFCARYIRKNRVHTAVYFKDANGYEDYYDLNGQSLKKMFLRSPLNYKRISSYFSKRRFHPILRRYRPHLGIDFAAPHGTPVSSVGDGVVVFAGWKSGYGKFVKIKHRRGFFTQYAHLSRYAKGIRKGSSVKQKQKVGYVGSTGLSTGPHLDYRIIKNGKFVNPLRLKLPSSESIKPLFKKGFNEKKENVLHVLSYFPLS